jgi:hypothetical protein
MRSGLSAQGKEVCVPTAGDTASLLQFKIWLLKVSPMVWRRILVPSTCTLRELHGTIQVAMGWEGTHLFEFCLRAARYGSWELSAASPNVTLAELQLRKGARFTYEYDLNIPWEHEIRLENRAEPETGKRYPACLAGDGNCPPEDCGGPAAFMDRRHDLWGMESFEDLSTIVEAVDHVLRHGREAVLEDEDRAWNLREALDRSESRQRAKGQPFSRRTVNKRLREGEHRVLMHQQY